MSLPRYPAYRYSGIEWLGDVPAHWEMKPLKHSITKIEQGWSPQCENAPAEDGEWGVLKVGCGNRDRFDASEQKALPAGVEPEQQYEVRAGDILMSRGNTLELVGAATLVGQVRPRLLLSDLLYRFRSVTSKADAEFLVLSLRSPHARFQIERSATGTSASMKKIGQGTIRELVVPLPPMQEQAAIVSFLARETARIDALVAEQERLIGLLREKRRAVISHAVTKGLNADAPMKESGIEWLGKVPTHWEVSPVKRYFTSCDGRRVPLSGEERSGRQGDFPYYGASGIIDWIDEYIFDEDLVLVSEDGANLLNRATPIAFVATGRYWVNNHAHILRPNDVGNTVFWAQVIDAIDLTPFVTGSAQPKFTAEALGNLNIAAPPSEAERSAIQRYINAQASTLDTLTNEAKRAIELLQERRTALISAAITGQFDVRGLLSKGAA